MITKLVERVVGFVLQPPRNLLRARGLKNMPVEEVRPFVAFYLKHYAGAVVVNRAAATTRI